MQGAACLFRPVEPFARSSRIDLAQLFSRCFRNHQSSASNHRLRKVVVKVAKQHHLLVVGIEKAVGGAALSSERRLRTRSKIAAPPASKCCSHKHRSTENTPPVRTSSRSTRDHDHFAHHSRSLVAVNRSIRLDCLNHIAGVVFAFHRTSRTIPMEAASQQRHMYCMYPCLVCSDEEIEGHAGRRSSRTA